MRVRVYVCTHARAHARTRAHTLPRPAHMQVLGSRIQQRLPVLKETVVVRIRMLEEELLALGAGPPATSRDKRREMLKLTEEFATAVLSSISGQQVDHEFLATGSKIGSAFIRDVFSAFAKLVETADHHIDQQYTDDYITRLIKASPGYNLPGFDSFEAFSSMVLQHHKKLNAPCHDVVRDIIEHIRDTLVSRALERMPAMEQYPDLKQAIKEAASRFIDEVGGKTLLRVSDHLATLEYVHSSDQEYVEIMSLSDRVEQGVRSLMDAAAEQSVHKERQKKGVNGLIDRETDDIAPMRGCRGIRTPAFRSGVWCPRAAAPLTLISEDWAFESLL